MFIPVLPIIAEGYLAPVEMMDLEGSTEMVAYLISNGMPDAILVQEPIFRNQI